MLRVFTHTVICSSSNASIDSSSIASHARIFGPIILGRLGATLRRSSKNVYPYYGAFPGLTMMRAGSVLKSKWTPVAASLRRNQPTAAGKFCLCKLNLAPGAVNGKLSAPLCVGHNRATLSAKDITDPLSHIFFATWCPSQKIRKFPARMVNLARARNFLCPSQVMPFCLSPPRLTCPFIPSFWNAVLTIFICACRNVGCFCAITTTLQAPGNEMWVSCIFSFLLWFLGSVASIHRPYPAYIKLCIMLFWPFCLHVEIFLFACRNLSYDFSCCETAARKESHWIFQGPMLLQQGLS